MPSKMVKFSYIYDILYLGSSPNNIVIKVLKVLTDEPRAFHIVLPADFRVFFTIEKTNRFMAGFFFQQKGSSEVSINKILDKQFKKISA